MNTVICVIKNFLHFKLKDTIKTIFATLTYVSVVSKQKYIHNINEKLFLFIKLLILRKNKNIVIGIHCP